MNTGLRNRNKTVLDLVKDVEQKYDTDLKERIFNFAVNTLRMLMVRKGGKEIDVIKYQLSKASTSIGANYEEAQSSSDREFLNKLRIALREANESRYWLKIIIALDLADGQETTGLFSECTEIAKMLGSIVSKLSRKQTA
jgi:four helix bundle protein